MVCVVLFRHFVFWDDWIPPDLHGFFKWVFDSLEVLNGFLRQVVVPRRDDGIRKWTRWLREDLSSGPYVWLRPDFLPPPFLVVKDPQTQSSQILVEPHLIGAEFRKACGCLFFCRSGHPAVTPDQFLDFVGHLLPQEPFFWIFLGSQVKICRRLLGLRSLLLVVWMVGLGTRPRRCRCPGFLFLLFFWDWLKLLEFGLRVCWMPILL